MFYGVTPLDIRKIAYELADRLEIPHPFKETTKIAGQDKAPKRKLKFAKTKKTQKKKEKSKLYQIQNYEKSALCVS